MVRWSNRWSGVQVEKFPWPLAAPLRVQAIMMAQADHRSHPLYHEEGNYPAFLHPHRGVAAVEPGYDWNFMLIDPKKPPAPSTDNIQSLCERAAGRPAIGTCA